MGGGLKWVKISYFDCSIIKMGSPAPRMCAWFLQGPVSAAVLILPIAISSIAKSGSGLTLSSTVLISNAHQSSETPDLKPWKLFFFLCRRRRELRCRWVALLISTRSEQEWSWRKTGKVWWVSLYIPGLAMTDDPNGHTWWQVKDLILKQNKKQPKMKIRLPRDYGLCPHRMVLGKNTAASKLGELVTLGKWGMNYLPFA